MLASAVCFAFCESFIKLINLHYYRQRREAVDKVLIHTPVVQYIFIHTYCVCSFTLSLTHRNTAPSMVEHARSDRATVSCPERCPAFRPASTRIHAGFRAPCDAEAGSSSMWSVYFQWPWKNIHTFHDEAEAWNINKARIDRLTIENTKIDTRVPLQANAVHFTRTRMASRIPAAESTFCRNFTIGKRPQDINHLVFPARQWEY